MGRMMGKYMAAAATAPQTVATVTAAEDQWQSRLQATGSLRAVRGADLSSQASGIVDEIHFDSGNDVPEGKVLLRLRPLDDYALLQQLEAAAKLAEQNYKRDQEQFAAQAISQAVIDGDVATLKTARAQVEAQHALIQQKIVEGAVCRAPGVAAGGSGTISGGGHHHRHAASARSHPHRFLSAATGAVANQDRAARRRAPSIPTRAEPSRASSKPSIPRSMPPAATCRYVHRFTMPTGA